jgi:DNA polymerase-3 subunit delta'
MSLKEILCQEKAISILQKAFVAGKSAHAWIFAGPEGVGKFKTACEWGEMLLCKDRIVENGFADSCGSCESCRLFEPGSHPDFYHVYKELLEFTREGKGRTTPVDLPVDVVREFLIDKVSTRPTLSERKVFVVSEAEKLNTASQNALLKVLEEPPEYCTIVLLCTRLEGLLSTTRSRCQIIHFGPVAEARIIEKLKEIGIREKQAQYWARLSQGRLGQACQWARLELAGADFYETKKRLLSSLSAFKYAGALDLAEWCLGEAKRIAVIWTDLDKGTSRTDINRRALRTIVQVVISAFYDAMKLDLEGSGNAINFDQKEQIKNLASRFGPEQAAKRIADCYRTLRQVESSVNEKLIIEQLLLNLAVSDIIKI